MPEHYDEPMNYEDIPEEDRRRVESEIASMAPPCVKLSSDEWLAMREIGITAMDTFAERAVWTDTGLPNGPTPFDLETLEYSINLLSDLRSRLLELKESKP